MKSTYKILSVLLTDGHNISNDNITVSMDISHHLYIHVNTYIKIQMWNEKNRDNLHINKAKSKTGFNDNCKQIGK